MIIASWNVNSLKVRLEQVLNYIEQYQPDVLAMQEIKCTDDAFPVEAFTDCGYFPIFSGQKTFNGVAIVAKEPIVAETSALPNFADEQKRMLATTLNGIHIINVYVPNGQSVGSEKYQYKLAWLEHLKEYCKAALAQYEKVVILGDFNIAPDDIDVYDPKAWVGQVLVSREERQAWSSLLSLGFLDSFRLFNQKSDQFTWWDYRQAAFRRNMGLRIDHILVSRTLQADCRASTIDAAWRKLERPSDHAPIAIQLVES